jgi:hypothetical protein
MHKFLGIIFIFSFKGSTCFGISLVHHQEQHLISCTVQLVRAGAARRTGKIKVTEKEGRVYILTRRYGKKNY